MYSLTRALAAAPAFATPHYAEPQRAYHNLAHVQQLLDVLEERGVLTPSLALAVWGHDLIYVPGRHDNEAQSAQQFGDWLQQQGVGEEERHQIGRLILATRHLSPPEDRLAALLLDADLSILGTPQAQYAAYTAAIRREYADVPGTVYRQGRAKVLRGFLERPCIFTTPEFASLEAAARRNLTTELAALERP